MYHGSLLQKSPIKQTIILGPIILKPDNSDNQILLILLCLIVLKPDNSDMGWLRLVGSLTMIGLFCRISCVLLGSFAKETYDFEGPTNRSHPIEHIITKTTMHHAYGKNNVTRKRERKKS